MLLYSLVPKSHSKALPSPTYMMVCIRSTLECEHQEASDLVAGSAPQAGVREGSEVTDNLHKARKLALCAQAFAPSPVFSSPSSKHC